MSMYGSMDATNFLPNLPGCRQKERPTGKKVQHFMFVGGEKFLKEDIFPTLTVGGGDTSIEELGSTTSYTTAMTSFTNKVAPRLGPSSVDLTLNFNAYFEEHSEFSTAPIDAVRIRKVNITYSVETGKISIVEKPKVNSGTPQGTLVRLQVLTKPDGSSFTPDDFRIGATVTVFGHDYVVYDCDAATKRYLNIDPATVPEVSVPNDLYEEFRSSMEKGPTDDWMAYRSKKNASKTFLEAKMGCLVNNSGREGYMKFGNQSLKFKCLWDNTAQLYGDKIEFTLNYFLSDDTLEVCSSSSAANKGQAFIKLLKRSKLPKEIGHMFLGEAEDGPPPTYHWRDFKIGEPIVVYARTLTILDADGPTRRFYEQQGLPLEEPVYIPEPVVTMTQREIPPPTGFGSEEDSLRSCGGATMSAAPAKIKKLGESRILQFFASLLSGGEDDKDRRFVISFYVQDQTIKIIEPPVRNSGFVGGVFLSRRQVKDASGEVINERQLFIGAKAQILKHRFLLLESNESTLRWLEDQRLPWASPYTILDKIRTVALSSARDGTLLAAFKRFEAADLPGFATISTLRNVLGGLFPSLNLVEHELVTILRAGGNKEPTFNYVKVVEQIISPTDEFK